jgi:hypothetical protein
MSRNGPSSFFGGLNAPKRLAAVSVSDSFLIVLLVIVGTSSIEAIVDLFVRGIIRRRHK